MNVNMADTGFDAYKWSTLPSAAASASSNFPSVKNIYNLGTLLASNFMTGLILFTAM